MIFTYEITDEMVEELEAMGHDMDDIQELLTDSIADMLYEKSTEEA